MPAEDISSFGKNTPLGRAGQPAELAPAYVLLASDEASYMTGALLPVTGWATHAVMIAVKQWMPPIWAAAHDPTTGAKQCLGGGNCLSTDLRRTSALSCSRESR
jgi:hypothetical protein